MAIIAIGQQLGSRGTELGRLAAAELGYRFVGSSDLLSEASQRYRVTPEQLQVVEERQPHFWERLRTDSERLFAYFRAVALREMARDRLVVTGRWMVPMVLPEGFRHGLRVRAVAPLAQRIKQVAKEEKLDHAAAERRLRDYDREVRARLQTLVGVDIDDPSRYHLIVNTAVPLEALAAGLVSAAREIDRAPDGDALLRLRDTALAAQVRAALLAHPKIGHAHIEVQCTGGAVALSGAGLVPPWDELVRQVVSDLEGVVSVDVGADEPPIPPPSA